MSKRDTKAQRAKREESEAKTARFLLEEKLDAAGVPVIDEDQGLAIVDDDGERDENGNVWFSVRICISNLDIELGQQEGK